MEIVEGVLTNQAPSKLMKNAVLEVLRWFPWERLAHLGVRELKCHWGLPWDTVL